MRLPAAPLLLLAACSSPADYGEDPPDGGGGSADGGGASADGGTDPGDGGGDLAACGLDPEVPFDDLGEILQLESAGGVACARFHRRNDCPEDSICKAVPFTILEARIGHEGDVALQDDPDAMAWESTWHNWNDAASVEVEGTCYALQLIFGDTIRYELEASHCESGERLWGPETLRPYPDPGA